MMKMAGSIMTCCVALLLVLTTLSAAQEELNSIDDLKKIPFGESVPRHSLLLLYWFANAVEFDANNFVTLTFDPDNRDYGSHYYSNFEELLDPLPWRHKYYTIGSLNQDSSMALPDYVVSPPAPGYEGRNRDRIIVRVAQPNTGTRAVQRIDRVYITQHVNNQREYDPDHTYRITTNLLREINQFFVRGNQQQLLQLSNRFGSNADVSSIRITWGDLAGLGLLLFIVIQGRYTPGIKMQSYTQKIHYAPQSHYGPGSNFTPQSNYGPGSNFTTQSNYGYANSQNDEGFCAFVMCIILAVVVVFLVFVFFAITTHGK